jgi:3'(2'), 5'-bisphosphate nucleotidase
MQLANQALLEQVNRIARGAGELVMAVYLSDFSTRHKGDASPVTEADERAEAFILSALRTLTPDIPIVAEEECAAGRIPPLGNVFWLVDPLDGTREFIDRNDEFTVNVALVENAVPVLGVVYAPAINRLYAGIAGGDAYVEDEAGRRPIRCRAAPANGLTVVASRSHGDIDALKAYLGPHKVASIRSAGSSLKLCVVAAGEADLYPRLGRTMEWDIAAGHAVLNAAGGSVCELSGAALRYGKPGFENPHFVSRGLAD